MQPTIIPLDPPLYLETPKGDALAYFLIWLSQDHDILWVCFVERTRECITFRNPEIRLCGNYTMGLGRPAGQSFPQRLPAREYHAGAPE